MRISVSFGRFARRLRNIGQVLEARLGWFGLKTWLKRPGAGRMALAAGMELA